MTRALDEGLPSDRDRWRAVAVAALAMVVASVVPLPARLQRETGPFAPDKALHLVAHAALAGLLADATSDRARPRVVVAFAVVASTAFGLFTERLQESVPGRAFERADVVAGFLGSLVGVRCWRRAVRSGAWSPPGIDGRRYRVSLSLR